MTWVLYPQKRAPVPNAQEAGWAPGLVWTNVKNRKYLNPTGVWNSDCSISVTIFKTLATVTNPLELEQKS